MVAWNYREGPVSFAVVLSDGRHRRCHQDQVRKRLLETEPLATEVTLSSDPKMDDPETVPREPETGPMEPDIVRGPVEAAVATPPKTYPKRDRKGFEPTW